MPGGKVSGKKAHGSAVELESKSSLFSNHSFHIDSDIQFVHVIRMPGTAVFKKVATFNIEDSHHVTAMEHIKMNLGHVIVISYSKQ